MPGKCPVAEEGGCGWVIRVSLHLAACCRYSVSVFQPPFQPPFQPGRMALEPSGYTALHSAGSPEAGDNERDSMQPPELQMVTPVTEGDTVPRAWAAPDRGPVPSTSGVSPEMLASGPVEGGSLPAGEKVSRPEGTSLVRGSAAGVGRESGTLAWALLVVLSQLLCPGTSTRVKP